jgi:hypothetical protein
VKNIGTLGNTLAVRQWLAPSISAVANNTAENQTFLEALIAVLTAATDEHFLAHLVTPFL